MSRITTASVAASARGLAAILTALLVVASLGGASTSVAQEAAATRAPAPAAAEPTAAPQPLSNEKIDQMVAPIALYPDNLLGQILAASTYPLEVVFAARWVAANPKVTGQALEDAMQQQAWDPSVKALTAVPQVLQMMSDKVEWTRDLGDAYLSQPDDIAASVQRLRARADASGNLKETGKLKVRRERAPPPAQPVVGVEPLPEYIVIEPVEPDVVYVPVYDPWVVYGVWPYPYYRPFYWYPPGYVTVGIIGFGAPCVVGAAIWARYSWHSRRVEVNVVRFNSFNKTRIVSNGGNMTWQKNSQHFSKASFNPNNKVGTQGLANVNNNGNKTFNNKTFNNKTNLQGQQNNVKKLNQQGIASINNQTGGTNKVRTNTGTGLKPTTQRLTTSQSFKPPAGGFKPSTNYRAPVRVPHNNNKH